MADVERLSHASSFGAAAAAYAEHRPDYAPAAVRWALESAPGPRVLEPDAAMLTELRRSLPTAPALSGSAEAIPLPDA